MLNAIKFFFFLPCWLVVESSSSIKRDIGFFRNTTWLKFVFAYFSDSCPFYRTKRRTTGKAKKVVPRPPPVPYSRPSLPRQLSNSPADAADERSQMVCEQSKLAYLTTAEYRLCALISWLLVDKEKWKRVNKFNLTFTRLIGFPTVLIFLICLF